MNNIVKYVGAILESAAWNDENYCQVKGGPFEGLTVYTTSSLYVIFDEEHSQASVFLNGKDNNLPLDDRKRVVITVYEGEKSCVRYDIYTDKKDRGRTATIRLDKEAIVIDGFDRTEQSYILNITPDEVSIAHCNAIGEIVEEVNPLSPSEFSNALQAAVVGTFMLANDTAFSYADSSDVIKLLKAVKPALELTIKDLDADYSEIIKERIGKLSKEIDGIIGNSKEDIARSKELQRQVQVLSNALDFYSSSDRTEEHEKQKAQ